MRGHRAASRRADPLARELADLLETRRWWTWFDARTFERGIDYAAEGRVADDWQLTDLDPGCSLSGTVAGSGGNRYLASMLVSAMPGRERSHCTCPVGTGCKHVVALLEHVGTQIEAVVDVPRQSAPGEGAFEAAWHRSLLQLEHLGTPPRHAPADAERVLALFLAATPDHPLPGLSVTAAWLRPSRSRNSKRLVDPHPIDLHGLGVEPAPPGGWESDVEERLTMLLLGSRAQVRDSSLRWITLGSTRQLRALSSLLAREDPPAIFEGGHTGRALLPGPGLTLRTPWRTDPAGGQRPVPCLEGPDGLREHCQLHQIGDRIWYIDPETGETGPADGAPGLVAWTRSVPPVPPERVAWATEQLRELGGRGLGVEAPEPASVEQLPPTAPRLVLRLGLLTLDPPSRPGLLERYGSADPSFRYGRVRLPPGDEALAHVNEDGRVLAVTRDLRAERALLEQLPPGLIPFDMLLDDDDPEFREELDALRLLTLDEVLPANADDWPGRIAEPDGWWQMLPALRELGVEIEFSEDFPSEPERLVPDDWDATISGDGNGWFDLGLDVEVSGERIHLLPLLRAVLDDPAFPLDAPAGEPEDATWELRLDEARLLVLPLARLRPLLAPIIDWLDRDHEGSTLRMPAAAATALGGVQAWRGPGEAELEALARTLAAAPDRIAAPRGLTATLRDYQAEGVAWLRRTALLGVGGVLADDMGLGKTVQVLAHVLDERERHGAVDPVLVVCPTSLVANWCTEAARFCPDLEVLPLQLPKAERRARLAALGDAELIVTTYALLVRDLEALVEQRFSLLVLDEAQAVKNPRSQAALAARRIDAGRRLAITGTPLENHLGELWAQLDLVAPGFLGSPDRFGKLFRAPIERRGEGGPLAQLRQRIAPLLLRRTRDEVLGELPEKTETVRSVALTGAQRELYESLRLAQHERVRQAVAERGLARSGIVVLDALLKLRQACCDPRLVKLPSARLVKGSAKLTELRRLLATLIDEDRRVLVFSQFTEMLALVADALAQDGIEFETLTGGVPGRARRQRIERFQNGEVPVFLISLRAGGTGLNLTAADTVIHYDPWWNPAIEAQATGRAHRMGQQRPVHVHRFVATGTVEERIAELQARKADLAASLLAPEKAGARGLGIDEAQLEALFAPVGES